MDIETDNPEVARISVAAHFTNMVLGESPGGSNKNKIATIIKTFNAIYEGMTRPQT